MIVSPVFKRTFLIVRITQTSKPCLRNCSFFFGISRFDGVFLELGQSHFEGRYFQGSESLFISEASMTFGFLIGGGCLFFGMNSFLGWRIQGMVSPTSYVVDNNFLCQTSKWSFFMKNNKPIALLVAVRALAEMMNAEFVDCRPTLDRLAFIFIAKNANWRLGGPPTDKCWLLLPLREISYLLVQLIAWRSDGLSSCYCLLEAMKNECLQVSWSAKP